MRRSLRLAARAKVNLFLEILGRRADGYHRLDTLFQEITLADELRVRVAPGEPGVELRCPGTDLDAGPGNLVTRAIRAFHAAAPWPGRYRVILRKRIPVGAGLGGGSSDAAAALAACWSLKTGRPAARPAWKSLLRTASGLGADVAFFLRGGLVRAGGIGDRLTPVAARKPLLGGTRFVLIFPRVFVSTKWVYGLLRHPLTNIRSGHRLRKSVEEGRPVAEWGRLLYNRLEDVVLPRVAAVRKAKQALLAAGCVNALMSGSGSTVFGLAGSAREAEAVARRVRSSRWDVWTAAPHDRG